MRLDKYLKVSRVIKRRTVANEACDAGRISVNGNTAKASYEVKIGDILEVRLGANPMKIRVLGITAVVKKEEVGDLYEII